MSRDEARDLLERCLKVLFYRDCRALNKVREEREEKGERKGGRERRSEREEGGREGRRERGGGTDSYIISYFILQYELAIITADGAEILGPLTQDTSWDIAHYVK